MTLFLAFIAATPDGMTLAYTDSPLEALGRIDITDLANPAARGNVALGGEPTSVPSGRLSSASTMHATRPIRSSSPFCLRGSGRKVTRPLPNAIFWSLPTRWTRSRMAASALMVMLFELAEGEVRDPMLTSKGITPDTGAPVGCGAVSGQVADAEVPSIMYAVNDGFYGLQPTIFKIDATARPARSVEAIRATREGQPAQKLDIDGITRDGEVAPMW